MTQSLFTLVTAALVPVAIFMLTAGCGGGYVYENTVEVKGQTWQYSDTLAFDFSMADTTVAYDLTLAVTHATDFGFQNLYVQIHTGFPSGEVKKQVVSLELANGAGIWNGECGGSECTVEIPLQQKARFREPGEHTLLVEQYMREDSLRGVKAMELKIKEVK